MMRTWYHVTLQTRTQRSLPRPKQESEELAEPLAAVMAREVELQSILKQQKQTRAGLQRAKVRTYVGSGGPWDGKHDQLK